jgi:mannan polymerase II complex MNN10 subunit
MTLSRSPSPVPGGGWASPGLNVNTSGRSSPAKASFSNPDGSTVTWESARIKSQGVTGYPAFSTQNQGFFTRHMRRISSSLPMLQPHHDGDRKKKARLGRGMWNLPLPGRLRATVARTSRQTRLRLLGLGILLLCYLIFWITRKQSLGPRFTGHLLIIS